MPVANQLIMSHYWNYTVVSEVTSSMYTNTLIFHTNGKIGIEEKAKPIRHVQSVKPVGDYTLGELRSLFNQLFYNEQPSETKLFQG